MPTCKRIVKVLGGIQGRFGVDTKGSTTQDYQVTFDEIGSTPYDAIKASDGERSIPAFGASLGYLVCTGKNAIQLKEDPRAFLVNVEYGVPDSRSENTPAELDEEVGSRWAVDIQIDSEPFERELQSDNDGNIMANTAGDDIKNVIIDMSDEVISIDFTTNIVGWDDLDACYSANGAGVVNSEAVTLLLNGEARIFLPRTLRFVGYGLHTTIDAEGKKFWRMKLLLKWRRIGWNFMAADMGHYHLEGPAHAHRANLDDEGRVFPNPMFLNGNGGTLARGAAAVMLPQLSGYAHNGEGFRIREEADLGTLILWGLHT
jgi:hypothetical protein